jgi:hypothetical protein
MGRISKSHRRPVQPVARIHLSLYIYFEPASSFRAFLPGVAVSSSECAIRACKAGQARSPCTHTCRTHHSLSALDRVGGVVSCSEINHTHPPQSIIRIQSHVPRYVTDAIGKTLNKWSLLIHNTSLSSFPGVSSVHSVGRNYHNGFILLIAVRLLGNLVMHIVISMRAKALSGRTGGN